MGLDDFVNNDEEDFDKKLKEELEKNQPPDESTWKEQEPGVPRWVGSIGGAVIEDEDYEDGDALKIDMTSPDPNRECNMLADNNVSLENKR